MDYDADKVVPELSWQSGGVLDAEGCFIYASAATLVHFGAEFAQIVGRPFVELLTAGDRDRCLVALRELDKSADEQRFTARVTEWRLTRLLASSTRWVCALDMRPMPQGVLATMAATSAAQDALQRKTAELQAMLRALPDLFFRFDADGRFLDYSAPSTSDLYAPPQLFLGKRPAEVMPPELAVAMEQVRAECHASGALATMEYELAIGTSVQQFEARYVPFLDNQTFAIVRNITERREAERALRASEARLRESQKIDAVGRLAGGVAHDFNNLLMIILGYTHAIARCIDSDHAAAPAVEEVRKAGERATALTKQLLALSRRQPMQPTTLDLSEILHEMDSMLTRVIPEHVTLVTEVTEGLRTVLADRSQVEQVVLNLVLNARDAMPEGGRLGLAAQNVTIDSDGTPRIVDARAGTHIALSVSDEGCGMDAATRARMFEAFFTTKPHGTGLGLFTVQHIVEEAAGRIRVSSQLGTGTRITVLLPALDREADVESAAPVGPLLGGRESVLVVEDEDAVRALVAELLRQLGYRVVAAANASEARDRLGVEPGGFHLLLTDIVMPGPSGWELASDVLRLFPACRVLYMSGHAIRLDTDSEAMPGGCDLLLKPFTPDVLAARVREALDRPH